MDTRSAQAEKVVKREKLGKYVYEQGESGMWRCPVCEQFTLDEPNDWCHCPICGALNSNVYVNSKCRIGEKMNFDETKRAWKKRNKT